MRGFAYIGEASGLQSDRESETLSVGALLAGAGPGAEVTLTLVPFGSQTRRGVDRDGDGFLDRDEIDRGSDPADPESIPTCLGDLDGDDAVGFPDLLAVLSVWGPCQADCPEDLDESGDVGFGDLLVVLSEWGPCE